MSEPGDGGAQMGRRRFIQATAALASGLAISSIGRYSPPPSVARAAAAATRATGADLTRPQVPGAFGSLDPALATVLRRGYALPASDSGQLLVLNYHKVFGEPAPSPVGNAISVTVSQLAQHLQMLRAAGFRPVRLADVYRARLLDAPMPPRSVLITFDDGTAGQWIHADAVLRQAGFTAVAFLITSFVGKAAAFVSWPEVRSMVASGRWEIGDHTHNDHHTVPSGPSMPMESALITRAWNPRTNTLETLAAAETRVRSDFDLSLSTLQRERLGRPLAFAYPFSRVDGPSNDPVLPDFVKDTSSELFPLRFTNFSPGRLVAPADMAVGLLPRFEVHRLVTALDLYEQIREANYSRTTVAGQPVPSSGPVLGLERGAAPTLAHGADHSHPGL